MPIRKTWKVLAPAPENFKNQFPQYSGTVLNLLFHRLFSGSQDYPQSQKEIDEFFNPDYRDGLHDPFLFRQMEKVVGRILEAKARKEKTAIFGDYDVDGITSCTVLYNTLRQLGIRPIVYIPDRRQEGYSMNVAAVKYLKAKKVKLIITVDCGIRDREEIQKAQKWGIDVIVTDHHLSGENLPPAYAIINPHVKNETYPCTELAGVGVSYKLAAALIQSQPKKFPPGFDKWLLDLVALGTVADLVPLVGENRTLVKYGLIVLGKTQRAGIRSIFELARIPLSNKIVPDTSQISFQIAPRLNAAGRMDHANASFELLKTSDPKEALKIAQELEKKNGERQRLTDKIVREIESRIDLKKRVIFAGDLDWPVGVAGLAAGKICERYARPVFIYNISKGKCRGSIRSISKFKVVQVLEQCKDLLTDYGGHDFAGGFTFPAKNEKKLRLRLNKIANKLLKPEDLAWETRIDERLELAKINWDLFTDLKKMEPFGVGNPTPLFLAEQVELTSCQTVGNGQKHLKMWFRNGNTSVESIAFGKGEKYCTLVNKSPLERGAEATPRRGVSPVLLDIVFEITSDEWNGQKKLQLIVRDLRLSPNK